MMGYNFDCKFNFGDVVDVYTSDEKKCLCFVGRVVSIYAKKLHGKIYLSYGLDNGDKVVTSVCGSRMNLVHRAEEEVPTVEESAEKEERPDF